MHSRHISGKKLAYTKCLLDLAKKLLSKGESPESDFDEFGVRNNENSFKDNYCISRRRVVIMTKNDVFQKERYRVLSDKVTMHSQILPQLWTCRYGVLMYKLSHKFEFLQKHNL